MEAVRYSRYLKPDGIAVINDFKMESSTTAAGLAQYPEGCLEAMQKHFRTITIKAADIAEEVGDPKCMNVVLFGALVKALQLKEIDWEKVIADTVPPKFKDLNIAAYRAGMEAAK